MIKKTSLSAEVKAGALKGFLHKAFGKNVVLENNDSMVLHGVIENGVVNIDSRAVLLTINGETVMVATNDDYSDKFEYDVTNTIYGTLN